VELETFVLGRGENMAVLEPEELRNRVGETVTAMLGIYEQGQALW
jgi:predicted DNA-binding transcriptional regulator YafY